MEIPQFVQLCDAVCLVGVVNISPGIFFLFFNSENVSFSVGIFYWYLILLFTGYNVHLPTLVAAILSVQLLLLRRKCCIWGCVAAASGLCNITLGFKQWLPIFPADVISSCPEILCALQHVLIGHYTLELQLSFHFSFFMCSALCLLC